MVYIYLRFHKFAQSFFTRLFHSYNLELSKVLFCILSTFEKYYEKNFDLKYQFIIISV